MWARSTCSWVFSGRRTDWAGKSFGTLALTPRGFFASCRHWRRGIAWDRATAERRRAARLRGEDPDRIDASAGTQNWIEAAARGEADVSAVPRDRSGLETALAAARRETLASLSSLTAAQLLELTG